jgi:hypothetical protein
LFLSIYGILIPFFVRGFVFTEFKDGILIIKIPLILTLFFSFTWLFIPNYSFLVPERWLLLSGIYISLIAIYGFFLIIDSLLKQEKLKKGMVLIFLFVFVVYGFLFIVMPSEVIFSFPSFFQKNTGFIFPFSMNFNSLKITDNTDLLKSIDWINSNTSQNSVIIGSKHWRGWFSLFLQPSHQYFFEDFADVNDILLNQNQSQNFTSLLEKKFSYLCKDGNNNHNVNYNNNTLLYFIDLNKGFNTTKYVYPYPTAVYTTKSFVIYNLTSQICKG